MATGVTGVDAMMKNIAAVRGRYPTAVASALYIESQLMATEVKKRTPVDSGDLRGTIHVVGPTQERNVIYALIVAGGPAAPYAIYVHENMSASHSSPPFGGGQAKFIESVIDENRATLLARIAARANVSTVLSYQDKG